MELSPELVKAREFWQRFKKQDGAGERTVKVKKELDDYIKQSNSPLGRFCRAKMCYTEVAKQMVAKKDKKEDHIKMFQDIIGLLENDVLKTEQNRPLLSACLYGQALTELSNIKNDWDAAAKQLEVGEQAEKPVNGYRPRIFFSKCFSMSPAQRKPPKCMSGRGSIA